MKRRRAIALTVSGTVALAAFPPTARAQAASVRIAASAAATQAEAYYADQLGFFKQAGITATLSSAALARKR